jgi:hypothetical protein
MDAKEAREVASGLKTQDTLELFATKALWEALAVLCEIRDELAGVTFNTERLETQLRNLTEVVHQK